MVLSQNRQLGYDRLLAWLRAGGVLADGILGLAGEGGAVDDLDDLLREIDRLKGWLDAFRPLPGDVVAELKQRWDVRFTYNSNAIEGNTLTQSETELVLSQGITIGGKTLQEHLEVVGHKAAIDYIEDLAQSETRIGAWEIKQIHSVILRTIAVDEAGRYRRLDVRAAGTEYEYPPHYLVEELMGDFVGWLDQAGAQLHPVRLAAAAHLRFVSIHPFRDGNGRTGRLLMNLLLLRSGFPIVVISQGERSAYIDGLVAAQQQGEDGALVGLVARGVRESLVEVLTVVATAGDCRGKGEAFYVELMAFLERDAEIS
jgi:Fic family protein